MAQFLLALILLACACGSALGQQYPFLAVPGSPKNVKVLFQDSKGRLWLGGDQLACFDGSRFFYLTDYGFPAAASYSITEDSGGAIWIGAESGVYRFANGRVEEISKGFAVSVIAVAPDMVIAAVGAAGKDTPINTNLLRIQRADQGWLTQTMMSLNSPGPLTLDHQGRLLYPWPDKGWNEIGLDSLVRWREGTKPAIQQHLVPNTPGVAAMRVLRDRFGCVWFGGEGGSQSNCGGNSWAEQPFSGADVRSALSEGPGGSILLTGFSILAVGRPGSFRVATSANGLPTTLTSLEARDGTIWLGATTGLYRFPSPFQMEFWEARDGVRDPWCFQRVGGKLFAGFDKEIRLLSGDRQTWQKAADFAKVGKVMQILEVDGTLIAAMNGGGAVQLRTDGKILARTNKPGWYGLRLAKAANHETWWGGLSLTQLTGSGSRLNMLNHGLQTQPAGNVLDVQYEPKTNQLFACYVGGIVQRNSKSEWREITTKDGLLVNPCWSLAALPNGDIWYGYYTTPAFALVRPNSKGGFSVRDYRASDDIQDDESLTLDVDNRGWLWRGGNRGLSVATPDQAEAGKWLFMNPSDGLPGVGTNSGSYFADTDGSVWFGMDVSVFHYHPPADLLNPTYVPQMFVSSITPNGSAITRMINGFFELPHAAQSTVHIGTLQFNQRNSLKLRYRILPAQPEWRESRSLDIPLGNIAAGTHTLEVQGRIFTGPWSSTISHSFNVMTPAWRSWPWLAVYAISGCLLLGGGYWLRERQRAEHEAILPDLGTWRLGALMPEVHELTGSVLDERFEVGDLLARGGFANVMNGYDRQQKQRCAVKVFRKEVKDAAWTQRRFEQEVAALQKVRHPNVVSIYAHGVAPAGVPYLVMEFIEGQGLRDLLDEGPIAPRRSARLLQQLADALDSIHALDICHRDVKPENIIIRNAGSDIEEAVLIDFSIAIVKDPNETMYGLSRAAGSFDYMPPEQVLGYADPSSDIYSLAKLAIEMLTGKRLSELLPTASLDLSARVREMLPGINVRLSDQSVATLASALEFDPGNRPRVAGEFVRPIVRDLNQPPELVARALA